MAVRASGVNPSDVKNRAGVVMPTMPFDFIVPHSDGAGVVERLGEGVPTHWLGKRVWVWNAQFRRPLGTAAESVTLPLSQIVELPDSIGFAEGASLGIPAMTAYRSVTCGASVAGQTVLVSGASGHVGRFAVQMAKALGAARVIATVGDPGKAQAVTAAGADALIGYRSSDRLQQIEAVAGVRGVDRIVEVEWGLNHGLDLSLIRPEGEIYVYGSAGSMTPPISIQQTMLAGVTVHFRSVYLLPETERSEGIRQLTRWLIEDQVTVPIGRRYDLKDIALAHEAVERRAVAGHVVVMPT